MLFLLALALATKALAAIALTTKSTPPIHQLSHLPGPVLSSVDIFPLFYGTVPYKNHLFDFYRSITKSSWWKVLEQYGLQTGKLMSGMHTMHPRTTATALNDMIDIQPLLFNLIKSGKLQPSPNTYYPIHLAPGISVSWYNAVSCKNFGGYHGTLNLTSLSIPGVSYVAYGVIPDCGVTPRPQDFATFTASHELAEAALNPLAGFAIDLVEKGGPSKTPQAAQFLSWFDLQSQNFEGEVADLCEGVPGMVPYGNTTVGACTFTVAKLWSNRDNGCVLNGAGH
ncbi:hypothetical protein BC830DRAFT_93540 [Chytriomyces sp. MP71]|nr:hypothetical protein BC830DRAFT_93540 [Chytriomyces sp. MP71]